MKGEPNPLMAKPQAQQHISSLDICSKRFTNNVSSYTKRRGNCEEISLKVCSTRRRSFVVTCSDSRKFRSSSSIEKK